MHDTVDTSRDPRGLGYETRLPRCNVTAAPPTAARFAMRLPLCAVLLAWCLRPASALITPLFAVSNTNGTQTWTASEPVAWSLLTRNNLYRVTTGSDSGYTIRLVDALSMTVQAGEAGGVFHVRALKNSCIDGLSSQGCVQTATWVVLTDLQQLLLLLAGFVVAVVLFLVLCQRVKPSPNDMRWAAGDAQYGTFTDKLGAFLDDVAIPDSSTLRRGGRSKAPPGRDTL